MYVGIDISKATLDLSIPDRKESWSETNDAPGFARIVTRLKPLSLTCIVTEATGPYGRLLVSALVEAALPVAVVNPRQARDYAKSRGKLAKTDRLDAAMLALFGKGTELAPQTFVSEEAAAFSRTLARRRQLVEMQATEKIRLHQVMPADKQVRLSLERHLKYLQKELKQTDKDLDGQLKKLEGWKAKAALLESAPGVGPGTARVLMAELSELGKVNRKEIAALVGVAPMNRDSGQYRGERHITGGRAVVRTALFMATKAAVRWDPGFKRHFEQLEKRTKSYKKAMVACMRKLLVILNQMVRTNSPWRSGPTAELATES